MEKTSKITKCLYSKPWTAPSGDTVHYHSIELENGDVGNVGVNEMYPAKISVNSEITYTINGASIKLLAFNTGGKAPAKAKATTKPPVNTPKFPPAQDKKVSSPTWKSVSRKNPEDYLGFVYGYAKDITIALINSGDKKAIAKPVELTNKMSEEFYANIKKLLGHTEQSQEEQ